VWLIIEGSYELDRFDNVGVCTTELIAKEICQNDGFVYRKGHGYWINKEKALWREIEKVHLLTLENPNRMPT